MMIRVAGLMGQVQRGVGDISIDGLTAAQQLTAIRVRLEELYAQQQRAWRDLRAELADVGIHIADERRVSETAYHWLKDYFLEVIAAVLTPQAIDPAHPFPFIANEGDRKSTRLNSSH